MEKITFEDGQILTAEQLNAVQSNVEDALLEKMQILPTN